MISFEQDIQRLRAEGALSDQQAEVLSAIDGRRLFSLYWELRAVAWAAVALIIGGVGVFLKNNYDLLGPLTVIALVGASSAGCYWFAIRRKLSNASESAVADYVLLLGALLLSADVGFAESQYHMLGSAWPRHLLLLAVLHGASAYWFGSRILLTLSITSLAAWLGIEQNVDTLFSSSAETGTRALGCAAILWVWRSVHAAWVRRSARAPSENFVPVFDHFIANLALWSALIWAFDDDLKWIGFAALAVFAALSIRFGRARNDELYVQYGAVYGYVGLCRLVFEAILNGVSGADSQGILFAVWFIVTVPAMIVLLFTIDQRMRRER